MMNNAAYSKHYCSVCYITVEEKEKKNRRTRDTKLFDALAVSLKFNLLRTPTVLIVIYKGRECRQIIENLYPDREVYLGYYSRILQKLPQQRGKKAV